MPSCVEGVCPTTDGCDQGKRKRKRKPKQGILSLSLSLSFSLLLLLFERKNTEEINACIAIVMIPMTLMMNRAWAARNALAFLGEFSPPADLRVCE